MNNIINQIAEALNEVEGEPEEPKGPSRPRKKISPMATSAAGIHSGYKDPVEPGSEAGELHPGAMPKTKRDPTDFSVSDPTSWLSRQLSKTPAKTEKKWYDERTYHEKRNKAISQVSQAVQDLSVDPDFNNLRHVLRPNKVPGFDILDHFYYESEIRDLVRRESEAAKNKGEDYDSADNYIKRVHEHDLLRDYSASPLARIEIGHYPFRIAYDAKVKDPETGRLRPSIRVLAKEIRDVVREQRKLQVKLEELRAPMAMPALAKQRPGFAGLSNEKIVSRLKAEIAKFQKHIDKKEQEIKPVRAEYDMLVIQLAEEYQIRIKKLKDGVLKILPERIKQALNKSWPKDYSDWLKKPAATMGPVTDDDVEDAEESAEIKHSASYAVKLLKKIERGGVEFRAGSILTLPFDDAKALRDAGEGEIKGEKSPALGTATIADVGEAPETPDLEVAPEKISSSIQFSTLPQYDEDESGILCEWCNVFHTRYNEYGDWNTALSASGYDPKERVVFQYSIGDSSKEQVYLRRHEIDERDLLNHPDLRDTSIFPIGQENPTVNAVKKDDSELIPLSYNKYYNLFKLNAHAQRAIKNKMSLTPAQKQVIKLYLPKNDQGGILSLDDIVNYNYKPVDENGGEFALYNFTNLLGEEEQFSSNAYQSADGLIQSLRGQQIEMPSYEGEPVVTKDLSNLQVYDQRTGGFNPWIIYDKNKDIGGRKMRSEALQIRLPKSPDSFMEEFKYKRPRILKTDYFGTYLVVKEFPWAVKEEGSWKLNIAKNLPIGDAIAAAGNMWANHLTDPRRTIQDNKGIVELNGVEDPNNIRMTSYRGHERELLSILGNIGRTDIANEIRGTKCTSRVRDDKEGFVKKCGNNARHTTFPEEVAMIRVDEKTGETDWKMVSKREAEARQELTNMQKGYHEALSPDVTADGLQNMINRLQGQKTTGSTAINSIAAQGALCDSCWLSQWGIVPVSLIKAMFDDLEWISRVSTNLLGQAQGNEALGAAKKEVLDLMKEWAFTYTAEGSFWETIVKYVEDSNLQPTIKQHTATSIERFAENIGEAVYEVFSPNNDLINITTPELTSGKPWFSRYVDLIMVQVNQLYMWAHAYRMYRYEHKDVLHTLMDPESYIIPFSRITRPDVREKRKLSNAISSMGKIPSRIQWGLKGTSYNAPRMESIDTSAYDRVIIDGFLNEEAYYNGLAGHIVDKQNGMCIIRLDPNSKLLTEYIKVYPGELNVIWEAPKELDAEKEYEIFIKETREEERLKDDIIGVISDGVSESLYY